MMAQSNYVSQREEITMKIFKNKTVIGIMAIFIGILVCFILTPIYNKSLEAKTTAVRVTKAIQKGQLITKDQVKEIEVGSYNLSENAINKEELVVGKYAIMDLYIGENILSSKIVNEPLVINEYLYNLDGEKGAVSITLQSFAAGLSGKLIGGDVVSIIATEDKDTTIPLELKYVKVLASTTSKGKDIKEGNSVKEDEDELSTTITLLVDEYQAKLLANLEANNVIHVELVYRGTEEVVNQYLEMQDTILKQISEDNMIEDDETINESDDDIGESSADEDEVIENE